MYFIMSSSIKTPSSTECNISVDVVTVEAELYDGSSGRGGCHLSLVEACC